MCVYTERQYVSCIYSVSSQRYRRRALAVSLTHVCVHVIWCAKFLSLLTGVQSCQKGLWDVFPQTHLLYTGFIRGYRMIRVCVLSEEGFLVSSAC